MLTLLTLLALLGLEEVRGAPRPQAEDTEATGRNIRVTQHVQVQPADIYICFRQKHTFLQDLMVDIGKRVSEWIVTFIFVTDSRK